MGNIIFYNLRGQEIKPSKALSSSFVNMLDTILGSTKLRKLVQKTFIVDEEAMVRIK